MKSLVCRIRKVYFDAIERGEKTVEYRKFSPFWQKRTENVDIAVFICGKRVHRRRILEVAHIRTPNWFSEQGKQDVNTPTCFAIYLGAEIKKAV